MTGLGRIFARDLRDHQYLIPNRTREAQPITSRYWLSKGPILDQGNTSSCVGHAGTRYLTSHPVVNPFIDPFELYREAQKVDEWPGEEPAYEGTSVRALFRVLKARGLVSGYRWAFDCETVVSHLLTTGPVVMGTDWTYDMMDGDRWGYIRPTGRMAGGHAYLLIGASRIKKDPLTGKLGAVRIINSWGGNWNQRGKAWMTFADLDKLIKANGEAGVASETKRVA